jgi:epoxyqueuosine reductase
VPNRRESAPRTGIHSHAPRATRPRQAASLWAAVEQFSQELGFVRVGCCSPDPFVESQQAFERWLADGHHGEMHYLVEDGGRCDPRALLADARSMLVVALPHPSHPSAQESPDTAPVGQIARYAQGPDYHRVIRDKLHELANFIATQTGTTLRSRICVDTAPILEREAARRAGFAFIGKNTLAIIPGVGSAFLLGVMLLNVDLLEPGDSTPTSPAHATVPALQPDGCGSCTACLDACPTQAFIAAHQLDARRCISYLTIELRGAIERDLRAQLGNRVFGCDRCQDVCPYNKASKARALGQDLPGFDRLRAPTLASWLGMTATDYRRLVKGTALKRTTRQRFQRNAAVALGNIADESAVPQLVAHLQGNRSALVRSHCAWALGRIGGAQAYAALQQARGDADTEVAAEAALALQEMQDKT